MSTIYVWVLLIYMQSHQYEYRGGGPVVIDNITTMEECQRVAKIATERDGTRYARCIQVQKVKP